MNEQELQDRYRAVYDWADKQPCSSDDFVHVPIESLEELLLSAGRIDAAPPAAPPPESA